MMADHPENGVPAIIERLDSISRVRPLTEIEVRGLERAIRRARCENGERQSQPWTRANDAQLRRHLLSGKRPAQIAILLRRSERAIWRRMYVLCWTVRMAKQRNLPMPPEGSQFYIDGIPAREHRSIPMPKRNVGE